MKCGQCNSANPAGARFCNACGARLDRDVPAAAPRTYTPSHLVERILTSKRSIEGERKQVTVLFTDVKASMELLAGRDPEEAREMLDEVVLRMMEAVHRYEGVVNQVLGDGIMALFGAPLACEDHAARACFAALRIRDEVGRYAQELRRTRGVPLHVRIGLNSGEVVVRSISNDLHMEYSAVGQATHLASRMEQMAEPGSAFLTASTLRLAGRSVTVKRLGLRPVKGLDAPVRVYELVGAASTRSVTRIAATFKSGFVARKAELARLHRLFDESQRVGGRAVGVVGEAGVGKSRLVYEFINSQSCRILGSCSLSFENTASWFPVIDLLRSYFGLDGQQGAADILAQVTARMRALDSNLESDISPILSLLDSLPESDRFREVDVRERRQRLLGAQTRLLLAQSARGPLLLVFENLQWLDPESRALLNELVRELPRSRLLLVMNYRPEFEHDWGGCEGFSEIAVEPLATSDARELLEALLGRDRSLAPLTDLVIKRSSGNPFFIEEIVRTLVETGAIVGEPGATRLVASPNALHVPQTVHAVLAARIDRLGVDEKLLLQQAAVIGNDFSLALLDAVTDLPEHATRQALGKLQDAGFIHQTGLFPEIEYRFRHMLTRETAYQSLLKEQRRLMHARAVAGIENLYADLIAAHLDDLVVHAVRGELWDKAVAYNRQAGQRALERAANPEVVARFQEALRALARLSPCRETVVAEMEIRTAMRPALLQLGRLEDVHETCKRVEELALDLGDERQLARAYSYLINYHYLKGETGLTIDYGARCLGIAEACGDKAIQGLARQYMGQSHHARGEYAEAERMLEANIDAVAPSRNATPYVSSCAWLAFSLSDRGEFDAAGRRVQDAMKAAEAGSYAYDKMIALSIAGVVAVRRGEPARAILPLQRSFELCRRRGLNVWHPVCSSLLGLALVRLGNEQDALRYLEDGVLVSRQFGVRAYVAAWTANLAEAQLAAGRREQALATARDALQLAKDSGERGHEVHALWLLGRIEQAPGTSEKAMALALELGMNPLAAQAQFDYGHQLAAAGYPERAAEQIALAQQRFSSLDMRPWHTYSPSESISTAQLFVVARSNTPLYEFLALEFKETHSIRVVLDRRERAREDASGDDERRTREMDADLLAWDMALTPVRGPLGQAITA